jgi:hypothetical protein
MSIEKPSHTDSGAKEDDLMSRLDKLGQTLHERAENTIRFQSANGYSVTASPNAENPTFITLEKDGFVCTFTMNDKHEAFLDGIQDYNSTYVVDDQRAEANLLELQSLFNEAGALVVLEK